MIPIGDGRRRFGFPWMTTLLLLVCLGMFLFEHGLPAWSAGLTSYYSFNPEAVVERTSLLPLLNALTCIFLQGLSWLEPIANLVYLWTLGRKVEDACGPWGFLTLYLVSGVGGAITALMLYPQISGQVYGLAGVVAGLFGAYFVIYRMEPIRSWFPPIILGRVPAFLHLLYWAGLAFVHVDFAVLIKGRLLQAISLDPNWPFLGAFFVGLLAGPLLTRTEFLYYRLQQIKAAAFSRR